LGWKEQQQQQQQQQHNTSSSSALLRTQPESSLSTAVMMLLKITSPIGVAPKTPKPRQKNFEIKFIVIQYLIPAVPLSSTK